MVDRMLDITDVQKITGGVPSRPTIIKMFRSDPSVKAKKYASEWHAPMSGVFKMLGLSGSFDDEVENKMLTKHEFGRLAGMEEQTIKRMIKNEKMQLDGEPIGCKLGREWRVSYNQAAEWLGLHVNFVNSKEWEAER